MGGLNGIQNITPRNFRRYGKVIDYPRIEKKGTRRNLWRIVHRSWEPTGWRAAYLVLRDKTIGRLECHPDSDETFEPIKGRAVLLVSPQKIPTALKAFWLDRPIVLLKGVWHGIIAVDWEAHFKIFENARVECRYFPLKKRIGFKIGEGSLNKRRKK